MKYIKELKDDETYLPITFQQFEDLTNEMLVHLNDMVKPMAIDARMMASVIMNIIHSLDKKTVIITKQEIFNRAINLLSNQMSYQAVEAIKLQIAKANGETTLKSVPDEPTDE